MLGWYDHVGGGVQDFGVAIAVAVESCLVADWSPWALLRRRRLNLAWLLLPRWTLLRHRR